MLKSAFWSAPCPLASASAFPVPATSERQSSSGRKLAERVEDISSASSVSRIANTWNCFSAGPLRAAPGPLRTAEARIPRAG